MGKWSWKRPFISLAFIYTCLFIVAVFFAEKLVFFPPKPGFADATQVVKFESTAGDSIAAFDLPARTGFPTLLYSHGNAEDIGDGIDLVEGWHQTGFGVLAYDFPGYGLSTGKPTEASCEASIEAAWKYLTETKHIAPSMIVLVGRSVGSGPSVWLTERKRPAGLILISPFTSVYAVRIPIPIFPRDRFPNLKRIPNIKCPLLVIHGADDDIIPPSHGRKLVAAATVDDKRFVGIPGAGHNDLNIADEAIETAMMEFARRVSKGR